MTRVACDNHNRWWFIATGHHIPMHFRYGQGMFVDGAHRAIVADWAYGNAALHNPSVTYEMAERAARKLLP